MDAESHYSCLKFRIIDKKRTGSLGPSVIGEDARKKNSAPSGLTASSAARLAKDPAPNTRLVRHPEHHASRIAIPVAVANMLSSRVLGSRNIQAVFEFMKPGE